jgi:hypothetical protein
MRREPVWALSRQNEKWGAVLEGMEVLQGNARVDLAA